MEFNKRFSTFIPGKNLLAAQFLCQSSILLGYKNPTTALREELAKAESLFEGMRQEPEGRSEQFKIVDALHSYTKGDLLYMIAKGNQSIENIRQGINAVEHSIVMRESLFQRGHTDLVRSYFALGNFYNMFGDLSGEGSTQQKDKWKMALKYYNKAWKMRTSLTKSELHLDLPNLLQSIATIYNNVGNNGKAIKFYKKALDIEKKLKVDGFYNTAVIKANVANCYRDMNKMNEAIEYAFDSLDIRKRLSGKHPDTVRSLYLVAVLFHCKGDYKEAINYYKEAFEMEEGLEPEHHSWHRMDIRRDMLFAFEDLIHRGRFEFQEEYEEWKDRFAAMVRFYFYF